MNRGIHTTFLIIEDLAGFFLSHWPAGRHTVHRRYANKVKARHGFTTTAGAWNSGMLVESAGSVDISWLSAVKADWVTPGIKCCVPARSRSCILMHPLSVRMMGPRCIYVRTAHRRETEKQLLFFNILMLAIICWTLGVEILRHTVPRHTTYWEEWQSKIFALCVNSEIITYPVLSSL